MTDHFLSQLAQTPSTALMALQTPNSVIDWLTRYGKQDRQRTRQLDVTAPLLAQEMQSIHLFGKFVEQEQLITTYESLITDWLVER